MTYGLLLIAAYLFLPVSSPAVRRMPEVFRAGGAPAREPEKVLGRESGRASGKTRVARWKFGTLIAQKEWSDRLKKMLQPMMGVRPLKASELLDAAAVLDILGACLRTGLPTAMALRAAALSAPPYLGSNLEHCSARIAVGARSPWRALAEVPVFQDLARAGQRAEESGTALALGLDEVAQTYRSRAGDAADATAERAGVLIAGPLALCFLPAFVVLGLVPTIAGLAGSMFAEMVPWS